MNSIVLRLNQQRALVRACGRVLRPEGSSCSFTHRRQNFLTIASLRFVPPASSNTPNPRYLTNGVVRYCSQKTSNALSPELKTKIEGMVKNGKKVVVFMKGDADQPKCGFSNAVVQILKMHGVQNFDAYNVLESDELRQGIKDYSEWPTIPQVYIDGEFVGGCDILLQMHRSGELIETLKKAGIRSALDETSS